MTTHGSGRAEGAGEPGLQVDRLWELTDALQALARTEPQLASQLAGLVAAMAKEATRSQRLARSLSNGIRGSLAAEGRSGGSGGRARNRRDPGVLDPFVLYSEVGASGLRARLGELELDQLRDIIAEHGMDNDRLAMKWKDPRRVIDRIVDRVAERLDKGSAFRA